MSRLLMLGATIGSAAMYFFDRDQGRRRRARVRDQAVKASSDVKAFVRSGTRDLRHRGAVATGRVRSLLHRRSTTDAVLVERVRARMGRYVAHPGAIEVSATAGRVTLTGSIFAHEREELVERLSSVPGVQEVVDQLSVYERAEGISELQGRHRSEHSGRGNAAKEQWAPGTRLVGSAAGTTLTLYALSRNNRLAGFVALASGLALLARAATNKPLATLAGMGGYRGICIQKTIQIEAPIETVFRFLANYDNFPSFMRNVLSVDVLADGRSHWKVAGPAGVTVEWDAITTRVEENELIEWSTIEGSSVEHAGSIDLERAGEGTRVRIEMSYNPPAGALGHVVAKLFGADPRSELDQDMMRLKSTLETGKPPHDAAAAARQSTPATTL